MHWTVLLRLSLYRRRFDYFFAQNNLCLIYKKIWDSLHSIGKGIVMSVKKVSGGFASEYDDQILWIESPEVGADAAQIIDESEYTPCKVTKIIFENDYESPEEYSEASDELLNESTATCTGEFVTVDGVFFVELDAADDTEVYESVDFDDVDFC